MHLPKRDSFTARPTENVAFELVELNENGTVNIYWHGAPDHMIPAYKGDYILYIFDKETKNLILRTVISKNDAKKYFIKENKNEK